MQIIINHGLPFVFTLKKPTVQDQELRVQSLQFLSSNRKMLSILKLDSLKEERKIGSSTQLFYSRKKKRINKQAGDEAHK